MIAKEIAKKDKKIRQLEEHVESLNELLAQNSALIGDKSKTNKYLTKVKHNFREYDETMNNIKLQQIKSLKSLKQYLLALKNASNLDDYEIENINSDLADINFELDKIK
jgi:hypothetical protein